MENMNTAKDRNDPLIHEQDSDDLLILKTSDAILSFDVAEKFARIPMYASNFLKNTTHFEAMSNALHMAKSHHALGAEESMAGEEMAIKIKEEGSHNFKVAINHVRL